MRNTIRVIAFLIIGLVWFSPRIAVATDRLTCGPVVTLGKNGQSDVIYVNNTCKEPIGFAACTTSQSGTLDIHRYARLIRPGETVTLEIGISGNNSPKHWMAWDQHAGFQNPCSQ